MTAIFATLLCIARLSVLAPAGGEVTQALQAALDAGPAEVVLDRDAVTEPLVLRRSNVTLRFEPGVVLAAKRGAFTNLNDCLLRVTGGATNVTICGAGTLRMHRADYADPAKYAFSEWRHTLHLGTCAGVTVRDLTLEESGGDGVYVSGARNVTLENLTCRANYRQGMSVIDVAGLVVRHCAFNTTSNAPPSCGVDFEPNRAKQCLTGILFEDCTCAGNAASGLDFHLAHLDATSQPVSMTFRRCTMRDNRSCGITTFVTKDGSPVRGCVAFEDCTVAGNGRTALLMCNQCARGLAFSFANCRFDGRGGSETTFRFTNTSLADDFAGVAFSECRASADARRFCSYGGLAGTGVTDVRGTVAVTTGATTEDVDLAALAQQYPPNPELRRFSVASVDYPTLRAAASPAPTAALTPWLRRNFTFVQCVPSAGDYPIRFRIRALRKGRQPEIRIQLRDKVGTDLGLTKIVGKETYDYVLHCPSPRGNVYRLEVQAGLGSAVRVESSLPGSGVLFDGPINLFGARGTTLHFRVPASAREVAVEVRPEEEACAELRDAAGRTVAALAYGRDGSVLKSPRAGGADEVWSVVFPKMREDCYLRIGAPALPIAATCAEALPYREKKK